MSTATHTIDAIHFTAPAPTGADSEISRVLKAEWTKLRTLPSTWRTAVMAVDHFHRLGGRSSASPRSNQWSTMTAAAAATFDPTACSLVGIRFCRRRAARGARRTGRDCRVRRRG